MTDDTNGDHLNADDAQPLDPEADLGREPELIPGRMGTRMFSMAALVERIVAAFIAEYGEDSPALREARTKSQQLRLLRDTVDYVLSVESVTLPDDERADLMRRAHGELFGFGPLDALFEDERITTISLDGGESVSVRYGHGDLTHLGLLFSDSEHLRLIVRRLLLQAGTELREDQPIIETGLTINARPVSLNLIAPPISFTLNVDMRLHPKTPLKLDDLVESEFMSAEMVELLRVLAASPHGFIIVGDAESGKTTLLNALLLELPDSQRIVSVERAGELRLPDGSDQLTVRWAAGSDPGVTFGDQIDEALQLDGVDCLLLDEVRSDAPLTIAPLLSTEGVPRQMWTFRGVPDAKRLQSALGMLARRANIMMGEELVHALYDRLPFVVTVARIQDQLQIFSVAEWQPNPASDYPDYVMLMQYQNGASRPTGNRPVRQLSLNDAFWNAYVDPSS